MNRATIALSGALAFGSPLLYSGCAAEVGFHASTPARLVTISPGVSVIYDYDEPVFYASGSYWWWNGSVWYRSRYANYGWVYVDSGSVPVVVRRIDRPGMYAHYRAEGSVRSVPPGHVRHARADSQPRAERGRPFNPGREERGRPVSRGGGRGRGDHDEGRGGGRGGHGEGRGHGRGH